MEARKNVSLDTQVVQMVLPSEHAYVQIARLTAVAMATNAGLGHGDADLVRTAVDEACSALLDPVPDTTSPPPDDLHVTFSLATSTLTVTVARDRDVELSEISHRVLDAASDDYGVDRAGDHTTLTVVKHLGEHLPQRGGGDA